MDPNLQQALRVIFLVLHILSVVFWLAGFVAGLAMRALMRSSSDRAQAIALGLAQVRIGGLGGSVGGMGILITGFALIGVDRLGFLGLFNATPAWLFIKQIVYIVAFIIGVGIIRPRGAKMEAALVSAARDGDMAQVRAIMPQMMMYGNLLNALVIINIILAVWKPNWFVVGG